MAEITLDQALEMVRLEYYRAENLAFVRNPLAYALFNVWKAVDANKKNRRVSDG